MKRFDTFGEYMFDLLFAPLKKGRKTVNQLCIFFKVVGREFDDLKAAIFRVRKRSECRKLLGGSCSPCTDKTGICRDWRARTLKPIGRACP